MPSGHLDVSSLSLQLFLGCLPEDREKWVESVQRSRGHYELLKKTHITDPHLASASLDITINNPLSQAENVSHVTYCEKHMTRQLRPGTAAVLGSGTFLGCPQLSLIGSRDNSDLGLQRYWEVGLSWDVLSCP